MNSNREIEEELKRLATQFLAHNYDYLWLRTMLKKCKDVPGGSTLITGSSHALNGIKETCWKSAVNCSMHSQDIYYDFACARRAITSAGKYKFNKCFIIMGYYIAFQDLSLSTTSRETMIANGYYPIFKDAHNWEEPVVHDPWEGFTGTSQQIKEICESVVIHKIMKFGTYYSNICERKPFFNLKGQEWYQIPASDRFACRKVRAESHNKIFQHKESFQENKEILSEFIHFLHSYEVLPIIVITPFTKEYNCFVLPEMRAGVLKLIDSVPEDIHFVDFNQALELFDPSDFMDTDHLNAKGAEKMSKILVEIFGS